MFEGDNSARTAIQISVVGKQVIQSFLYEQRTPHPALAHCSLRMSAEEIILSKKLNSPLHSDVFPATTNQPVLDLPLVMCQRGHITIGSFKSCTSQTGWSYHGRVG